MPANFTELQICNKALLRLAANQVDSPDGRVATITTESLEAKLCKLNFPVIRDIVLEDRIWSFALKRVVLDEPEQLPPEFGYGQKFVLPSDALCIWRVSNQGFNDLSNGDEIISHNIPWSVEDNELLCNYDKVFVRYIRTLDSADIVKASNQFVDVLSLRLAVEFCMPLTENATMQQALMAEYEKRIMDASSIDGGQATREIIRSNSLNNTRWSGRA